MKRTSFLLTLVVLCLLSTSVPAGAQASLPAYEFGVNLGLVMYQGDLTPHRLGAVETQKLAVGLHASRIMSASFSVRAQLLFSKLKGDDALYSSPEYRQQRNFTFHSPITELSGQLVYILAGSNYRDKGLLPYVFAGAGIAFVHIRRDWSRFNAAYFSAEASTIFSGLTADSSHALPRIIPVIPVGGGVKYFIKPRIGINAEASYRISYTDYLDGFSQAANPALNDHYLHYSVGIIYRTGQQNRLSCPVMKY